MLPALLVFPVRIVAIMISPAQLATAKSKITSVTSKGHQVGRRTIIEVGITDLHTFWTKHGSSIFSRDIFTIVRIKI